MSVEEINVTGLGGRKGARQEKEPKVRRCVGPYKPHQRLFVSTRENREAVPEALTWFRQENHNENSFNGPVHKFNRRRVSYLRKKVNGGEGNFLRMKPRTSNAHNSQGCKA